MTIVVCVYNAARQIFGLLIHYYTLVKDIPAKELLELATAIAECQLPMGSNWLASVESWKQAKQVRERAGAIVFRLGGILSGFLQEGYRLDSSTCRIDIEVQSVYYVLAIVFDD